MFYTMPDAEGNRTDGMTQKIFWRDPYLTQLTTHVTSVAGEVVTVADTIFYAFSGGQESDSGTLGDYPVLRAEKAGLDIHYTLPAGHALQPGQAATMTIDWARRYRLMRLHFAAELILELAYRHLPGIEKIGAHIAQDKARIDFQWPTSIKEAFPHLLATASALIQADHPIVSAYSDEATQRRTWHIAGFATVACGGTHLRTTGEIGTVRLSRKNIGQGKERIEIYVD